MSDRLGQLRFKPISTADLAARRVQNVVTRSGVTYLGHPPQPILDETSAPPRAIEVQSVGFDVFQNLIALYMDWQTPVPGISQGQVKNDLYQPALERLQHTMGPQWTLSINASVPVGERWKVGIVLYVHPFVDGKVPYAVDHGVHHLASIAVEW